MVSELERMAEAAKAARIKLLNDMSVVEPRTPGEPWPWTKYVLPKPHDLDQRLEELRERIARREERRRLVRKVRGVSVIFWLETAILGFVVLVIFLNALS